MRTLSTIPLFALALLAAFSLLLDPAAAVSIGDMAEQAAGDFEQIPGFISIGLYIVGAIFVFVGFLRLKRHFDHPQQTTLGGGMITILVGAALIASPSVINGISETFGVDTTATISRPKI